MNAGEDRLADIRFRGILESRGEQTIECEVTLSSGAVGRASAPVAIAPGRHEASLVPVNQLGDLSDVPSFALLRATFLGRHYQTQAEFDADLVRSRGAAQLGANVRLAMSVAFCRARAMARGASLVQALALDPLEEPCLPRPVANVFGGGIHGDPTLVPYQNIMISPNLGTVVANIDAIRRIYGEVERGLGRDGHAFTYSASSGMIVPQQAHWQLFRRLQGVIEALGYRNGEVGLGVDVAAEHLLVGRGRYRFGVGVLSSSDLSSTLQEMVADYGVEFLEDPFDSEDQGSWRALHETLGARTLVVGDDVFATRVERIDSGLAGGILLKPNQIGSTSGALDAAREARSRGLVLCVSHRSGETEDPFVCDFAVAVGARFIKVGGPRRGDRTVRYNQLLRLEEAVTAGRRSRADRGEGPVRQERDVPAQDAAQGRL